ncbi:epoxyqueuosine reductase QueH [Sediminispirochaeta bajacaliforniensis]|uniref:epoxyqueuosine reductase QueH n=1 Tax=Sediminispirochaeta bajacaliforniensis TaxID=148 RepID=UPI00036CB428|nr:epoxyqueuosine reductase QueH [Sediminispirochaeta bajacaliforniensis]
MEESVNVCYASVKMATEGKGVKILLHACCAPCAAPSAERLLEEGFLPTLFYSNPNIAPEAEWKRRLEALEVLADAFKLPLIVERYDHASWLSLVRGLEKEPERGRRCTICFRRSIDAAAEKARRLNIPRFTTTLTLSPLKNTRLIFALGNRHEGFLERDFKKKSGVARSVELCRSLGLYRQNYCGCEFSLRPGQCNP